MVAQGIPFSRREKVAAKRPDEGTGPWRTGSFHSSAARQAGARFGGGGSPSSVAFGDIFSLREKGLARSR
jgi:hypothetical protein